jgi:hypothetical protein
VMVGVAVLVTCCDAGGCDVAGCDGAATAGAGA